MKRMFSIVIAIYNTEQYLKECIDSVINQTIGFQENVELILVNDGSIDNCEKICLEYQKKYPNNIIYIYQENSGVSAARNAGINKSTGKYINFLDSDDKFSNNLLEVVKKIIVEEKVNICAVRPEFFDFISGNTSVESCFKNNKKINILEDKDFTQQAVNNVFIKRTIIKNHFFDEKLSIGEDAMFINSIFLRNPMYYVTNLATYYQRRRQSNDSLSECAFNKKTFYIDTVNNYFIKIIEKSKIELGYVPIFLQKDISRYIAWMLQSNVVEKILNKKEIVELIKNLENITKNIDLDNILNDNYIEIEYKYLLSLLKQEKINVFFTDELIKLDRDTQSNRYKYIFVNHSLNSYILKNDKEKIILYALEMNKFYNKLLNEKNKILEQNINQKLKLEEMEKSFNIEINNLNIKNQKINEDCLEKKKELENMRNNYNILKEEYEKIILSKSWKITSPLRKIRNIFKKEVKK